MYQKTLMDGLYTFWKRLSWAKRIGLTVVFSVVFFHEGWCWGLFGRDNLFLQYVFQCNCLPFAEAVRYYPSKVLASACTNPQLDDISPNRRFALIAELGPESSGLVHHLNLVNLETREKRAIDLRPKIQTSRQLGFLFVNDDLIFVSDLLQGGGAFLLDLNDNSWTSVSPLGNTPLNSTHLQALQNAEMVIRFEWGPILSVARNYKQHPEQNLYIYATNDNLEKQQLKDLADKGIGYITFLSRSPEYQPTVYSSDRRFWADAKGIYSNRTKELIVATNQRHFGARYWVRDNRAVVYDVMGWMYLMGGSGFMDFSLFHVAQPILLLEIP